jgi:hypothetical protein
MSSKKDDNEKTEQLLTQGQASCLVFGLAPTKTNRNIANDRMKSLPFLEVVYKRTGDPFEPLIIGKKLRKMNPFLYKSYPSTPELSFNNDEALLAYHGGYIQIHIFFYLFQL